MPEFTQISVAYSLDVAVGEMLSIINRDKKNDKIKQDDLGTILERVPGVKDVDYSDKTGPYIFLSIESKYDNLDTKVAVKDKVNKYLDKR